MEVHAHSHTLRKKWTHYFWEFFMLFLAVTAGFIVENWREHIIENNRAKELAKSIYYEIHSDSVKLEKILEFRLEKEKCIKYLSRYIQDSNLALLPKEFCPCLIDGLISFAPAAFDPRDANLEQLKSSGMLRYFKDSGFQQSIADLALSISTIRTRNERERIYFNQYVVPLLLKHLDQDWVDKIVNNSERTLEEAIIDYKNNNLIFACRFKNADIINKDEVAGVLNYYSRMIVNYTRLTSYKNYAALNHKMQMLLREKYHIK
jgi:hypothetical protein